MGICTADAATPWWEQATICRLNPSKCYASMGAGFESEMWDVDAKCRGMKYICPEALVDEESIPVLISKKDIDNKSIIKTDYDANLLSESGDCFGRRKTNKNGNEVMIKGEFVKVWCDGVLNKSDETLSNGEVVYGTQPTCNSLKENGYIAAENGKCFGKYYDASNYHIECGDNVQPERIVVLNGAEYKKHNFSGPVTNAEAEKLFDKMYDISKTQKAQYFKK